MKFYDVTFWNQAYGGNETVLVIAKNKKAAVKLTIEYCKIYVYPEKVYAKAVSKQYPKGLVIL
jgi:hypothetical protein